MRRAPICLLVLAAITACSRETATAPDARPSFAAGGQGNGNGRTSLDLIEQDFADGLLDKNNANRYRAYAVEAPQRLPAKYKSSAIGKDATYSMLQIALDWDQLSTSTQQEILDLRGDGFGQLKGTMLTPHFVLHFTTQGNHAVPAQDNDGNGVSDFIDAAAERSPVTPGTAAPSWRSRSMTVRRARWPLRGSGHGGRR